MYVQPNTTIHLIRNVGLDNSYTNTHYFANVSQQYSYFVSHAKRTLNNYSYVIPSSNIIRVNIKADEIYDVNYIAFQNTNFGAKWFYAFVNSIDYVSNDVSDIHFEIDVIQTWLTEYQLKPCFIERMHSATDGIGDNIKAENITLGEYVVSGQNMVIDGKPSKVVLAIGPDESNQNKGEMIDNVFSGIEYTGHATDGISITNLNNMISNNQKRIVAMYMTPDCAFTAVGGSQITDSAALYYKDSLLTAKGALNGYTPKNNKLYTYPYTFIRLSNGQGGQMNICFEYCDGNKPRYVYSANATQPVSLAVRVQNYKHDGSNTNDVLLTTNYPSCTWSQDTYTNYLQDNATPTLLSSLMTTGITMSTNPVAGLASGAVAVGNMLINNQVASNQAYNVNGNNCSGGVNFTKNFARIMESRMTVNAQTAKMIDDYFTRYGYAIKEITQPNITSRKSFNYIKTCDCSVTGFMPSDVAKQIADIHNRGITYWHNHEQIGNFLVDNTL